MAAIFKIEGNEAFKSPREKLKAYFSRGDLFYSNDSHLCFVCGASGEFIDDENKVRSMRTLFFEYVEKNSINGLVCIRAELAAIELLSQYGDHKRANLSDFEAFIADIVSSVLIFPESPGSFAELGFFSAHKDVSEKILVAVKHEYQDNSFISLGPIHFISSVSHYRPAPIAIGDDCDAGFRQILERLSGGKRKVRRNRFDLLSWKDFTKKQRLSILDEIIEIAGALTEPDLKKIIFDIFGPYDIDELRMLISLLCAMRRIRMNDDGDVFSTNNGAPLMVCNEDSQATLKSLWLEAYKASQPEVLDQIGHGYE